MTSRLTLVGPASAHMLPALTSAGIGDIRVPAVQHFPDGECLVRIGEVASREVVVLQSTPRPQSEHLLQAWQMVDAAVRGGARRVRVLCPYLGYSRQDRVVLTGEPVTGRLVAQAFFSVGAHELGAVDLHAPGSYEGLPVTDISPSSVFEDWVRAERVPIDVVVAPDRGAHGRAATLAARLGCEVLVCAKTKDDHGTTLYDRAGVGVVRGARVLVVDDLCSSGSTLVPLHRALTRAGAADVRFAISHVLCDEQRLSGLSRQGISITTLDTATPFGLSTATLVADWIDGTSQALRQPAEQSVHAR